MARLLRSRSRFSDGVNAAEGTILVNVRAEGAPEVIRRAVEDALGSGEMVWRLELREIEAFRPGKPVPGRSGGWWLGEGGGRR